MCPPSVGVELQPDIEQASGQDLPVQFSQCCFHDPQPQDLPPVPPLFAHPVAVSPMDFLLILILIQQNRC